MKKAFQGIGLSVLVGAAGCSMVHDAMSNAMGSAGSAVGNAAGTKVGNAIGDHLVAAYTPGMMNMYTSYLFTLAFSSGGTAVEQGDYSPGDWTRWLLPDSEGDKNTIERGRLADDDKGNQWWKVKFFNAKEKETTVLEGLFTPDRSKLLRLRGKFPKEEAKEIPVTEKTYYVAPTRLTPESIEGATKGSESVTVPAGTFEAKHVVYAYGNGSQEWWLADGVPGGLVKQTLKSAKDAGSKDDYTLVLAAKGSDAVSELGSTR